VARTYKLNYFTKGTGASIELLDEDAQGQGRNQSELKPLRPRPKDDRPAAPAKRKPRPAKREDAPARKASTPLPPGHVRKKATGEIGRVKAVDARAGTITVQWLKRGQTSTVPLTTVTRR
jgi:hypothetical protein